MKDVEILIIDFARHDLHSKRSRASPRHSNLRARCRDAQEISRTAHLSLDIVRVSGG